MKNRKLFIVSFLVVATLVVGVGFAAINGTLNVTGDAAFFGFDQIKGDVAEALAFTHAEILTQDADSCTATVGETVNGLTHSATLDVNFFDTTGSMDNFEVQARYTISYGTEGAALPDITLSSVAADTFAVNQSDVNGTFDCVAVWEDANENPEAFRTLKPGDSVNVIVTVTYEKDPADTGVNDANYTMGVRVAIPYDEVEVISE